MEDRLKAFPWMEIQMTAPEFRITLKALGITLGAFAALTGTNITTASYWGRERPDGAGSAFPAWVPLLLDAWQRAPQALRQA